jgi:hypothetical protein
MTRLSNWIPALLAAASLIFVGTVPPAYAKEKEDYPGQERAYYACRTKCMEQPNWKKMMVCDEACSRVFNPTARRKRR